MVFHPSEFEEDRTINRLGRLRRLGWVVLFSENALRAFWRPACWAGFFMALWLLQLPAIAGRTGETVCWMIFLAGMGYLAWRGEKEFRWPGTADVDRRLERAGKLSHRPLSLIQDRLVNPEKELTGSLWKQGREAAFASISRLRPFSPLPLMNAQDPRAIRALILVFLFIGFTAAGSHWQERIVRGLFPFALSVSGKVSDDITLWITPPEYTGKPQIILQGTGRAKNAIDVPEGSTLKARVHGWFGTPEVRMGNKRLPMARSDEKNWALESGIPATEKIVIRQGFLNRSVIPVNFIPDAPPTIALKGEIKKLEKGSLQIPLTVKDDYGIRGLTMRMTLDPAAGEAPLGAPVEETRVMASAPGAETELNPIYDLSWHPWAGMPVLITMEAKDAPGHTASLPPIHATLPERPFFHPAAKKLVALRKRLIWTPEAAISNAVYELEALLVNPSQIDGDIVAFLSIRSMASRLYYDPSKKSAMAVIPQLWDTALRIEEGNLTMASRDLRKAQKALQDVLSDPNATDEQIAAAMENLRQSMAQYFQEMFREMQKKMAQQGGGDMPMLDPKQFGDMIDAQDLSSFLDQLQSEALSGNRDSAQQLLSQLQQMMDGMDPSSGGMDMPPQLQEMMKRMSAMKELIEKQQNLLDRTQKEADKMRGDGGAPSYPDFLPGNPSMEKQWGMDSMPPPPQPDKSPGANAKTPPKANTKGWQPEQDGLRKDLGNLMLDADEQMGEIPEGMQKAEQEMRGSGDKLGEDRPDLSAPYQKQALDHLQDSMESMNQQMGQMLKQMTLMSFGMGPLDPLGRPMNEGDGPSMLPGSKVKIPDEAQRKRVQEIMKTLRQRSGELERPDYELEYYRRLMKQF